MEQQHPGDTLRLGLDFGVGATVIGISGPGRDPRTRDFPGVSRQVAALPGNPPVHLVPSVIEYRDGKPWRQGEEVLSGGAADAPSTARWLRRVLCDRNPVQVPAGNGRMVRYDEAAADFLVPLLAQAQRECPGAGLAIALPADAPAEYAELLQRIARRAGAPSCTLVSEYDAALAGYGFTPADSEPVVLLVFSETDLGAIVLSRNHISGPGRGDGSGLQVLARATAPVSCRTIDDGIVQDLLAKFRLHESDPRAVRLMPRIRHEAARVREQVPVTGEKHIRLTDPGSGKEFMAGFTIADLDRVLDVREIIPALRDCIGRACSGMQGRGQDPAGVRAVILLGPGSALPAVQGVIRSCFPSATVYGDHPLDAVALGAAVFPAPVPAPDRIACSYALRYWDPALQEHHYRFLVHSGTRYPSAGQVARFVISAVYDGQTLLGIPLYEIGGNDDGARVQIELVSDTGGGVRLAGAAQDAGSTGPAVHANERSPTLLVATPPARKGEPRFECTFVIDPDRNLCLSARDLVTGTLVKVNAPVHRLK